MNKFKILKVIIIFILIIVMIIIINLYDVIFSFILQSEKIGVYEINLMLQSKYDKNIDIVEIDQNIKIPLPIGTIKFKNNLYYYDNQYLVSNKNLEDFLNNEEGVLDKFDIICEQYGSIIIIKNKYNYKEYINLDIHQYTRNFIRLIINTK